jgi:hypothetical protein
MINNEFIQINENKFEHISLQAKVDLNSASAINFLIENHHLQIFRNEFINCNAMFSGALGFFQDNSAAIVQHNNFTNCSAINGGGITLNYRNYAMKFIGNVFFNCTTANTEDATVTSSGALNIAFYNYDITITNSNFYHCHSSYIGGAITVVDSNYNVTFDNLLFDSCSSNSTGGSIHLGTNNSDIIFVDTKIINSSSVNYGGGIYIGSENSNINITYCSFIDNYCYKGGALYFDKTNRNINFVGNLFQNNSALFDGGACYFNDANTKVQFIDEDSFKSFVMYYNSIPKNSLYFQKQFTGDDVLIVLFKFDSISSNYIRIDIKVDNESVHNVFMEKSNIYFGVRTPPLLLYPNLFQISVLSPYNNLIIVKFYLLPVWWSNIF